jgi:ribosomal protein L32
MIRQKDRNSKRKNNKRESHERVKKKEMGE